MPTRIIRPEIITSDVVNQLTWQQEVFYRRLLSIADDYGLYDARIPVMRAALFPLRLDRVSDRDVQGFHDRLVELGMVKVYTVEERIYGQIVKFGQQYKSEPKFPIPPWANPDEYHPPKTEKKTKSKRSVTRRNEPLQSVTNRYLDEDEDVDVNEGEGESFVATRLYDSPPSAAEVRRVMGSLAIATLTGKLMDECVERYLLAMEACEWRDSRNDRPIRRWQPHAKLWAKRFAENEAKKPTASPPKRNSTYQPSTRLGCNDPADYD